MSVGAAADLLSSGAMGDDYGRRRVFLAGTGSTAVVSGWNIAAVITGALSLIGALVVLPTRSRRGQSSIS